MSDVFLFCLILGAFFLALCGFVMIINKPYYSIAMYFAGSFIRRIVLPDAQVRVQVAINLMTIAVMMGIVLIGNAFRREKRQFPVPVPCFVGMALCITLVAGVETINGYFSGYRVFQILVDIYKVAEILIFFVFIRMTMKTRNHVNCAIRALVVEMCVFGLIEIFTTERGGVGLNILMSVFPLFLGDQIERPSRSLWPVTLIAVAVLVMSKTRTYMIGMVFGIFVVILLSRGTYKRNVINGLIATSVIGVVVLGLFANDLKNSPLYEVLQRFQSLLSGGFSTAGGYRIYEIQTAWSKFLEAPLLGKGYGFMEYVYINLMGYFDWGDFMHNAYMEILCKTGLFGCLIFGAGLIAYLRTQRAYLHITTKMGWTDCRGIMIGGLCGTLSWLVVYTAAPLSSYGSVFLPGILSLTYFSLYRYEWCAENA